MSSYGSEEVCFLFVHDPTQYCIGFYADLLTDDCMYLLLTEPCGTDYTLPYLHANLSPVYDWQSLGISPGSS